MCELLIDVDAVIKLAAYDLMQHVSHPGCDSECTRSTGITAATRFVAASHLQRKAADPGSALLRLGEYLQSSSMLEPSEAELSLAASLEGHAARAGVALDTGESQLCAIAILRQIPAILTGDKRAIAAAETLLATATDLTALTHRIACLEQAVWLAVERLSGLVVRARVQAEPGIDKAITICFEITRPKVPAEFEPVGLASYIHDARESAPTLMMRGNCLQLPSVP